MMKLRRNQKGFTLVEVLLIVVILGIIAAIAIPRLLAGKTTAQMNTCKSNVASINAALEKYRLDKDVWTESLDVLAVAEDALGEPYFPSGKPICPADGTYTIDPDSHVASCGYDGADAKHGAIGVDGDFETK